MDLLMPALPSRSAAIRLGPWLLALGLVCLWASPSLAETAPGIPAASVADDPRVSQVFSPGDLSAVHAEWDSLRYCSKCHASENRVDPQLCLDCHETLGSRISARSGFHGSASVRGEACETCHAEHDGKGAETIAWPRGRKSLFPHADTGWPLNGAHREEECAACHETRRIVDRDILALLKKFPKKQTHLGLDETCTSCHFDEHRGALKEDCQRCHDEARWSPAPGFDHDDSYPLRGAHARADCVGCHAQAEDKATPRDAFPTPKAWTYLTFGEIPHESCTDCHEDPHRGRLGEKCLDCHTLESWDAARVEDKLAFHETTRYPLRGEHRDVSCQSCHPTRGGKKLLRPIPFERCTDCHPSAHPDLPAEEMEEGCEGCHSVDGFAPADYTLEDHAGTAFPIEGAHTTVSCQECHTQALGEPHPVPKKPARIKGRLARQLLSPWRLVSHDDVGDCASCHASPHRDQFEGETCASCHQGASWAARETFDHAAQTEYPLDGRHAEVDCALCHLPETDAAGTFTRYTPVDHKSCAPCHGDVHYGQFEAVDPPLSCQDCHVTEGFDALRFDHDNAAFSDFPLKGAHSAADCADCHLDVKLSPQVTLTAFRPLPTECALCHEDNHHGAYREAGKLVSTASPRPRSQTPLPWDLPPQWGQPHGDTHTDCAACHKEESWAELSFNHDLTRFPLKGGHIKAECVGCHTGPTPETPPMTCAECHEDVHRGNLGASCESCHTEAGFNQVKDMLARHARTSFPLIGQHAVVPCSECHADVRDLGFTDAPTQCEACHLSQAPGPGSGTLDHTGLTSCQDCHTPMAWKQGALTNHERCFPIRPGTDHAQIACADCHTSVVPAAVVSCDSGTAGCVSCHGCESGEHRGVQGYECEDRKCYSCHPGGS